MDGVAVAVQMRLIDGPKNIAIGDKRCALTWVHPSPTASVEVSVVVTKASGVHNVDRAVVTAGGSTVRTSRMSDPVLKGRLGSVRVGSHVVAVPPTNATRTLGGGLMITSGVLIITPRVTAGTSSTAGLSMV